MSVRFGLMQWGDLQTTVDLLEWLEREARPAIEGQLRQDRNNSELAVYEVYGEVQLAIHRRGKLPCDYESSLHFLNWCRCVARQNAGWLHHTRRKFDGAFAFTDVGDANFDLLQEIPDKPRESPQMGPASLIMAGYLDALTTAEREAYEEYVLCERTQLEVGRIFGVTGSAVKCRMERGRARLLKLRAADEAKQAREAA